MPYHRLLTTICLFLAVFMAPWWMAALIALIALIALEHFYEALVAGIAMDALYGMGAAASPAWPFLFFTGSAAALFLLELAKQRMRVFER